MDAREKANKVVELSKQNAHDVFGFRMITNYQAYELLAVEIRNLIFRNLSFVKVLFW